MHHKRATKSAHPEPASCVRNGAKRRVQSLRALYYPPGVTAWHLRSAVIQPTLFVSSEAWAVAVSMGQDTDRDIAPAEHCVAAVLVAAWWYDSAVVPGLGGDVGSLARHFGVPKASYRRGRSRQTP